MRYLLLAVLVMSTLCDSISSHVLTSLHKEVSFRYCVKRLANLYDLLCGIVRDDTVADVYDEESGPPVSEGLATEFVNARRAEILTNCCLRPCAYAELWRMC